MNEPAAQSNDLIAVEPRADSAITKSESSRTFLAHLAFAVAIAGSIAFARAFAIPLADGGSVTTIWPATGIALGVILRFGRRFWPSLAIGNGIALWSLGLDAQTFVVTWVLDTAFPLVAATILNRFGFDRRLTRTRDVFALGLLVAIVGTSIPATIQTVAGSIASLESVEPSRLIRIGVEWWLESAMGVLVFTPLLLVIDPRELARLPRAQKLEGVALLAAAVTLTMAVFRGIEALSPYRQVASLLAFPLAMIAAFRFGKGGAALLSAACAIGAVLGRSGVSSGLDDDDVHAILIDQTAFLIVVSLLGLTMAAMLLRRIGTELLLASTQSSFRSLFLHSPIGIAIERAGTLRFVNRRLLDLLGYAAPDSLIGRGEDSWIEFIGPARRDGARDAACLRKDGTRVDVVVTEAALPQVNGVDVVRFVVDTTERRALERELQRARRMESVGSLAGGIAHEFNDLLTVIAGYVDLLRESTAKDSRASGSLDQVAAATEKASALTRQLSAVGRSTSGLANSLDISVRVRELAPDLRRRIGERVDLAFDLAPELPPVRVVAVQFDSILLELVEIARNARRLGGVVTVRTRRLTVGTRGETDSDAWPAGEYAVIEVHDTGVGIADQTHERPFDPTEANSPARTGNGVELASLSAAADSLGARIRIERRVGSGTIVAIGFPAIVAGASEDPPRAGGPPDSGDGISILVVQEDPALRGLISQVLVSERYRVKVVASASEALESLAQRGGRCDLLVTDVTMPRMSGAELARCVRRHWPMVRCLFLTGYSDPELLAIQREIESEEFLSKPFTNAQLLDRVRSALASHGELRAPRAANERESTSLGADESRIPSS